MKSSRYDNLDVIKAFAILAVISLHVPLWSTDFVTFGKASWIQYAIRLIMEGVPFFLTINGFLLLKKREIDLNKHIKKIVRLVILLLVWSFILAIAGCALSGDENALNVYNVCYIVMGTRFGSQYTGVLWFIQGLIGVYLIYPVVWYVYNNNYKVFNILFAVLLFFVVGIKILTHLCDFISALSGNEIVMIRMLIGYISMLNPMGDATYLFYFCLGGVIWVYKDTLLEKRKMILIFTLLAWPLAIAFGTLTSILLGATYNDAFNYVSVFMTIFVIGVIVTTLSYKSSGNIVSKLVTCIGRNTFGMYFVHYFFIFIAEKYIDYSFFAGRLFAYFLVCISSFVATLIIKRIPIIKELIAID